MNEPATKPKVAIGADFLSAFADLPVKQQNKVSQFLEKFRTNPRSSGINYENIQGAHDPNLHSVRIDREYRGVVLQPHKTNIYLLLWVGKHDKAYEWAWRRQFKINPHSGALQVIPAKETSEPTTAEEPHAEDQSTGGLFAEVKDKHLLRLGVPEELLPLVRRLQTDAELEQREDSFPQEVTEALYMLAMGYSLEDVFAEQDRKADAERHADPADFEAALENADTQRRFHVLSDSFDLAELLKSPLEKWRVFLHPSQRKLVTMHANGPVRVLGGAGTGKTVVAMHRAKHLAESVFPRSSDRLLFTTFTRNLAQDIAQNLTKICSVDTARRIEVVNLDSWVHQLLKKHGYDYRILNNDDERRDLWQKACLVAPEDQDLPLSFYEQEWAHVIQAQGVSTAGEYMRASRIGRGQRLSRLQRKQVWPVFEEYRSLLNGAGLKEFTDAVRDARILLENKGDILNYQSVIVDEAQDMSAEAFKLIRQIVPTEREGLKNDIFIVGDAHQRIYAHRVVLGRCGIDIRGRGKKLRLNYRTTNEIRRWSVALLENRQIDDLDGREDNNKGYRSLTHGRLPEVKYCKTFEDEVAAIVKVLADYQESGAILSTACLVARTGPLLEQYERALTERRIQFLRLKHNVSDDPRQPGLRTATMHRVKGIEFDTMVVVGVNEKHMPLQAVLREADSEHARQEAETKERSLLYVAATRARKYVQITCHGQPSPFLETK